mmetsp:Transcript_1943/g.3364  ORF Transcript_1943/g.3364 Transcript_1943/m.3364 type:complete len:165 (+) Transcript_1943:2675-3169(+)
MFFQGQVPPQQDLYTMVQEWNLILIDLENNEFVKQAPLVHQMQDYRDIVQEEHKMKPKLYSYPNWNESMTVFDFEDLQEDAMLVLCVRAQIGVAGHEHDQHKVFIWKGNEFDEEEASNEVIAVNEFVDKVLEVYWGCKNPGDQFNIMVQHEPFGQESDEFQEYF